MLPDADRLPRRRCLRVPVRLRQERAREHKSERENIGGDELDVLQSIARQWLDAPARVARDAEAGILIEVKHDQDG